MGDERRKNREYFFVNSDKERIEGYYDMEKNRIRFTKGYSQLEDGETYRILSRCGTELKVKVDMYKKWMHVLGVYEDGKFIPGKRVNKPNDKTRLELICFEEE
ncbi:hypothetical protein KY349_02710 [Candidatus Woesearchaeota archaeon]|nr:hypothetical protein [Candidatus Woesearchaeota archaeon]